MTTKGSSEEFYRLTDSHAAINYASSMKFEWWDDKEIRQAWLHVEKISEHFLFAEISTTLAGGTIAFVTETLGSNIGLKLYRYYLAQCERFAIEPRPILTLQELHHLINENLVSDEEGLELYRHLRGRK